MCAQCKEADEKIAHYRRLASCILDRQTLDSIAILIAALEAQKKAAHVLP
jgi:hypothetical protein